jgi:hypothetical protein
MTQTFAFKQDNGNNWDSITKNLNIRLDEIKSHCKKDFEVEIREIKKKRSGQQLKAFWVLIKSVADWMNEKGNRFTSEQVSAYFKINSGHCNEIEGQSIPKSIANRSDCTKEQMEALITTILVFGAENLIEGCQIEDLALKELLNYYK